MKKIISFVLVGMSVLSCTNKFEDINRNPYGVTDEEQKTIPLGSSNIQEQNLWVMANQENGWQMYMDLPGIYSGYCAVTGFNGDFNAYVPRAGWNDYVFDDAMKHLYPSYNAIKSITKGDLSKPIFAVSTLTRIAVTHRLADIFGPVPYSKVDGVELNIPYDNQRELYLNLLKDLKEATMALDAFVAKNAANRLYEPYDFVYKGDMSKWAKYGRSLMLRLAVRIASKEPELAKQYAEYAVANGVIETNEDNAKMETNDNPTYKVAYSWTDSRVGADIVEYMTTFSDPRTPKYFTTIAARGNVPFGNRFGNPINIKEGGKADYYSCPNIKKDTPIMWINASEVAFLKAEGALNGWNMGGKTAKELYEEGIKLSFAQWGVDESRLNEYLSNTNVRSGFTDIIIPDMNAPTFNSSINVNWDNAQGDKEKQLSKIITQKWIAMFPYNTIEAWTEWRRTGYPNMMPSLNNKSGGAVKDIYQENGKDRGGMRRLVYSTSSVSQNKDNINKAIEDLGGPDANATDLWWAK